MVLKGDPSFVEGALGTYGGLWYNPWRKEHVAQISEYQRELEKVLLRLQQTYRPDRYILRSWKILLEIDRLETEGLLISEKGVLVPKGVPEKIKVMKCLGVEA